MRFGADDPAYRTEDRRLLTGAGRFLANRHGITPLVMVVVRSPRAHADLRAIDTARAANMPGVAGILTADDLGRDGIGTLPCSIVHPSVGDRQTFVPPFDLLARDRVRYTGQAMAAVFARTRAQALDAAEAVEVAYEDRDPVIDPAAAVSGTAPAVWDAAPDNVAMHWRAGDAAAVEDAFSRAHRVVALDLVNNRVSANPMEPRGAAGGFEPATGTFTLHTTCQGQQALRAALAEDVLGIPPAQLRVVCGDVGGGFGMKAFPYVEQALVLLGARRFGRAVSWYSERSEALLSDYHGRDHRTTIRLALDGDGRFLALKVETLANVGAFLSQFGLFIPTDCHVDGLAGAYDIPAMQVDVRAVFTNSSPVDAYRGAGRAEGTYALERVIDTAARATGIDPLALRLRNLVRADALPYRNALGRTYDSGDFTRCLEQAARRARWASFASRRPQSAGRGGLRGIGIGCALTSTGHADGDIARIGIDAGGHVLVVLGNLSCGQGHETSAVRLVSAALGIDPGHVRVIQGDSDQVSPLANSNGASNFLQSAGPALDGAARRVIARGRRIAAHLLEAGHEDIEFDAGAFLVAGTDRQVTLGEVAAAAHDPSALPDDMQPGWDETYYHRMTDTWPFACHVAEVEVSPETGEVEILGSTVVCDFGRLLNPDLVTGQVHGGLLQGIGQALCEHCVYDGDGQLVSASFLDYAMPRADRCPAPDVSFIEQPSSANPLGVKGCGEVPTACAAPAVINAILDALAPLGVHELDMPATPARVWQAIRKATRAPRAGDAG